MPITLEQARTDLRAMLSEHSPVRFGNPELNDWLSQGQQDTAALTLAYQRRVTLASTDSPVALLEGVREYALTGVAGSGGVGITDPVTVLHVFRDGNSVPKWSPEQVPHTDRRSEGGGTPAFWYQFAGNLGFVPYPNSTFLATTWSIEIVYAAYPTDWTTGPSVLPSGFDELPTYTAYIRALISQKAWADAFAAWQNWLQLTLEYRQISLDRAATPKSALQRPTDNERLDAPSRVTPMRARR